MEAGEFCRFIESKCCDTDAEKRRVSSNAFSFELSYPVSIWISLVLNSVNLIVSFGISSWVPTTSRAHLQSK